MDRALFMPKTSKILDPVMSGPHYETMYTAEVEHWGLLRYRITLWASRYGHHRLVSSRWVRGTHRRAERLALGMRDHVADNNSPEK